MKTKSKKAKTGLGHHKWLCFRRDHDLQKAQKRYSTRIGGEPQRIEIDGRYLYLGPIPEPEQPEQTEDILPYGEGLQQLHLI
jgi:hypothetical protein